MEVILGKGDKLKISQELNEMLNNQVNKEFENVLKYKKLESYYDSMGLVGIAKIFAGQVSEEFNHANQIIDYINTRLGGEYIPENVEAPDFEVLSPQHGAELFLEAEVETSEELQYIADYIYQSHSYMDINFIQTMLGYQITEEMEAELLLQRVNGVNDIFLFDSSLESD